MKIDQKLGDFEISQSKGHLKNKSNQMTKVWQRPISVIINKRVIAVKFSQESLMTSHLAMELAKIPIKANRWYKRKFD